MNSKSPFFGTDLRLFTINRFMSLTGVAPPLLNVRRKSSPVASLRVARRRQYLPDSTGFSLKRFLRRAACVSLPAAGAPKSIRSNPSLVM